MWKTIVAAAVVAAALSLAVPVGAAPVNGSNTIGPFTATCTGVGAPSSLTGLRTGPGTAVWTSTGRVLVVKSLTRNGVLVGSSGRGIDAARLWTCTATLVEDGVSATYVAKLLPTR
jgi:hypothetical protein